MAIYLNAAGHGLCDPAVGRRMAAHLAREAEVGEMRAAGEVAEELAAVRAAAAGSIGAAVERTGLSQDTGGPWRTLVSRLALRGRRVLAAPHEWGDNLRWLSRLTENAKGRVETLPPLDMDAPDLSAWRARIDSDVAAILAPMVTSVTGLRYPVEAIGALPRPDDALFVVDAAQAVGQGAVDVAAIGCDALFATTRKWVRGPMETGLYWVGERAEAVTGLTAAAPNPNVALRLGQGVALRLATGRGEASDMLRRMLRVEGIEPLPGTTGAVTLRVPHGAAVGLRARMVDAGIVAKWPDPALDEPASGLSLADGPLLRLSPHVYNTEHDIRRAADVLCTLPIRRSR